MQTPSIGRVVHFNETNRAVNEKSATHRDTHPQLALITDVKDGMLELAVFPPGGTLTSVFDRDGQVIGQARVPCYTVEKVSAAGPNADGAENGCWRWPPRV